MVRTTLLPVALAAALVGGTMIAPISASAAPETWKSTGSISRTGAAVSVDQASHAVFIAHISYKGDRIAKYDPATGTYVNRKFDDIFFAPFDIAADSGNDYVYATDYNGYVKRLDWVTGAELAFAEQPIVSGAFLGVDPTNHRVYLAAQEGYPRNGGVLRAYDGLTGALLFDIDVTYSPTQVAVDPMTHTVYVAGSGNGELSIVNGLTGSVSNVPTSLVDCGGAGVGCGPSGVAVDSSTHRVYVSNDVNPGGDSFVAILSGGAIIDEVPIPLGTSQSIGQIAVDSSTHLVYITGFGPVTVMDGTTGDIVKQVKLPSTNNFGSIAVDSTTHIAYAGTDYDKTYILKDVLPPVTGTTPKVTGTVRVGSTLGVNTGAWSPGATLSYQWLRNGVPIGGETGTSLVLDPAVAGAKISISVSGQLAGYSDTSKTSARTAPVAKASFIATPVSVDGSHATGSTLTAVATWNPVASFEYRWYRNGTAISGADDSSYVVQPADRGAALSVGVTGAAAGYVTTTVRSAAVLPVTASPARSGPPVLSGPPSRH